jgi:hypothetical protein
VQEKDSLISQEWLLWLNGQIQNNPNGAAPDGSGGILRVTQDGQLVANPPLGTDTIPLV